MARASVIASSPVLLLGCMLGCGDDASKGVVGPSSGGSAPGGGGTAVGGGGVFGGGTGGSAGSAGSAGGGAGGLAGNGGGGSSGAAGGPGAVPSCKVTFSEPTPTCGKNVTANWSCSNALTCSYVCSGDVGASGPIDCAGSTQFPISAGLSCTLTGKNGNGITSASASVACDGRPVCSLFLDVAGPPQSCPVTGTASWSCVDADACSYSCSGDLSGSGSIPCTGDVPVNLVQSGSCTLTATSDAGVASAEVSAICP